MYLSRIGALTILGLLLLVGACGSENPTPTSISTATIAPSLTGTPAPVETPIPTPALGQDPVRDIDLPLHPRQYQHLQYLT